MKEVIVTIASIVLGIALAAMVITFKDDAKGLSDVTKKGFNQIEQQLEDMIPGGNQ